MKNSRGSHNASNNSVSRRKFLAHADAPVPPSGNSRGCAAYSSHSELLEKEKDLDAVVVCTADHLHAAISAAAMRKHKHVFCQKPLTHTIYEARRISDITRETGVATQIAVGNQASEDTRHLSDRIWPHALASSECASHLPLSLSGNIPARIAHHLQLSPARRYASGKIHVVRRRPQASSPRRTRSRPPFYDGR